MELCRNPTWASRLRVDVLASPDCEKFHNLDKAKIGASNNNLGGKIQTSACILVKKQ